MSSLEPAPADYIDALVCGLPANERGNRLLMTLQAYFDDSGSHKKSTVFVLAGFISTVDRWKAFSDEWKVKLDEYPGVQYFKMSEAVSLRGEFLRGWTSSLRDQRVLELCEIIKKHALAAIDSWMFREFYDRTVAGIINLPEHNDPYFPCFCQVVISTATFRIREGGEECDIIFDEQGPLSYRVLEYWEALKQVPAGVEGEKGVQNCWQKQISQYLGTTRSSCRCKQQTYGHGL